jgi:hypothetical protein
MAVSKTVLSPRGYSRQREGQEARETSAIASYVLAKSQSEQGIFLLSD